MSNLEKQFRKEPRRSTKQNSVKEFIIEKRPENDVEKTLVVGYYIEHSQEVSPFNVKDLEEGFREGREIVPGNLNDKVAKNIRKGHMMDAAEKDGHDSWTLTNSGERIVENGLPKSK